MWSVCASVETIGWYFVEFLLYLIIYYAELMPGPRKVHGAPDCPFKEAVSVPETVPTILVLIYNLMKNTYINKKWSTKK